MSAPSPRRSLELARHVLPARRGGGGRVLSGEAVQAQVGVALQPVAELRRVPQGEGREET